MEQHVNTQLDLFLRRLEMCDFPGAQALCTDRATVWKNDGNGEQTIDETLDQFKSFVTHVDSLRYDVVRRFQDSDEVFQQHVLHLKMTDGTSSEVHAVVDFRFEGELIDRIEEYVYTVPTGKAAEAS